MNKLTDDIRFMIQRPRQTAKRLLNVRDELSYLTVLREVFMHQSYLWLMTGLKPDTTAIDLGAYRGESAIYIAMSDKVKKVIAIEPSLSAYETAKRHIRESQLGRKIRLINNAVSKEGKRTSNAEAPSSPLYKANAGKSGRKSVRLSDLINEANSNRIIIKCDVEGAESEIFDCDPRILKGVYKMQIECHDTINHVMRQMKRLGFKAKVIEAHRGIFYKQVGYVLAWR